MKKKGKIALIAAAVVAAAGVGAAAWQWNNLSALRYGLTMDQETLTRKMEENRAGLDEAMERYQIRQEEITQDQLAQLADGTLTPQETAQKLLEEKDGSAAPPAEAASSGAASSGASSAAASGASSGAPAASLSAEDQEIRQLIATMYVLQASYEEKVALVAQAAIDEYTAGEHTPENRTRVVYKRVEELLNMEAECDAQVAQVVSRLRELLKATGQSDELAKQVENAYQQEKSLKKAYYLNAFRKG